jgi:hypothetical protein
MLINHALLYRSLIYSINTSMLACKSIRPRLIQRLILRPGVNIENQLHQQQPVGKVARRSFHRSTPTALAVRRRQRNGVSDTGESLKRHDDTRKLVNTEDGTYNYDDLTYADGVSKLSFAKRSYAHVPVTDPDIFYTESRALLERVEAIVKPLQEKNNLAIEHGVDHLGPFIKIVCGPEIGTYYLYVVEEQASVGFGCLSGSFFYQISSRTGEWVCDDDGHSFEGMLMRDLLRHCVGLPKSLYEKK